MKSFCYLGDIVNASGGWISVPSRGSFRLASATENIGYEVVDS